MDLFETTEKKLWERKLEQDPSAIKFASKQLNLVPMTIRDKLQAKCPDVELLFMTDDAYDEAIVGVVLRKDAHTGNMAKTVAYNQAQVIEVNMAQGMTEEEALEYFDYNQAGAYVGEQTPFFVYDEEWYDEEDDEKPSIEYVYLKEEL